MNKTCVVNYTIYSSLKKVTWKKTRERYRSFRRERCQDPAIGGAKAVNSNQVFTKQLLYVNIGNFMFSIFLPIAFLHKEKRNKKKKMVFKKM